MFFERHNNLFRGFFNKSLLVVLVFLLFFNFVEASEPDVVINEVAWMGNEESSSSEWIELKNLSDKDIDLTGWILELDDKEIELEGEIKEDGFYLLERTDDESVPGIKADLIYTGSLSNNGEVLKLRNLEGEKIDEVDAEDGWSAGDNETKQTMERVDESEWQDSKKPGGTPGKKNSAGPQEEEVQCSVENQPGLEKIILNEIFPNPIENEDDNEWIELYNYGDEAVDLNGCFLADGNLYDKADLSDYFDFVKDEIIEKGELKVISREGFKFGMNNSNEEIYLLNGKGEILDEISYEKTQEDYSYSLDEENAWVWTETKTPGEENQFPVPKSYSKKLEITELMLNPDSSDKGKEWVELFNGDLEKIELKDWYLLNQSNKKFKLDGLEIKSVKWLKVEIKETSFSLRNSQGQVDLINPNGEVVDTVSYTESAKEEASLNKNSENQWLWSIFITPGAENKFNNPPTYKVEIPDEIYEDIKAEFKIKKVEDKDKESLKYRWDFGDGSKSYLQETTHVFDQKGKFTIQTRVGDLSIDIFKDFKITVKKFPELDLRIVKISPNPEGADADNEKIWLENLESKTVNLKGWIIATGSSSKSLTNHYIKDDFKIKPNKIKILDRNDCPFSLLNKKGRVVLKSPDRKIVDKVKYEKEKIAEDEVYYLENDDWFWEAPIDAIENPVILGDADSNQSENVLDKKYLITLDQILGNPRFNRTDGLRVLIFDNWLFVRSKNPFFKFIFPVYYQERLETANNFKGN